MLTKAIYKRKRCKDRASPFKCQCGNSYQTLDSLHKHQRDRHNEEFSNKLSKKEKKFEGEMGRPVIKNKEPKEPIYDEISIMEEEIYEKTLVLLLETEMNLKDQSSIICNLEEEFSNLQMVLKSFEPQKLEDYVAWFLKELSLQNKTYLKTETIPRENLKNKENPFETNLKKLAFLVLKSADFLKPAFLEYFVLVNMEILRGFFHKRKLNDWSKCMEFFKKTCLQKVFKEEELLIFNTKHQENVLTLLKKWSETWS